MTVKPSSPYRVAVGRRASFECVAEGNPSPIVSWRGPAVVAGVEGASSGSTVYTIPAVTAADGGVYTCVAESPTGRTEASVTLVGESAESRRRACHRARDDS